MKKDEVEVGKVYAVKVSGAIRPVRITGVSPYGGWDATNLTTKRDVRIRSAQKLRYELETNPETGKWRPKQGEAWWRRKADKQGELARAMALAFDPEREAPEMAKTYAFSAGQYAKAAATAALNILGRE